MTEEAHKVEVTRVKKPVKYSRPASTLLERFNNALGPVTGGLILDMADFLTFGPIGLYIGFFAGAVIGWWIGSTYGFSLKAKLFWATLAGVYCLVPMTEFVPIATMISAGARFYEKNSPR